MSYPVKPACGRPGPRRSAGAEVTGQFLHAHFRRQRTGQTGRASTCAGSGASTGPCARPRACADSGPVVPVVAPTPAPTPAKPAASKKPSMKKATEKKATEKKPAAAPAQQRAEATTRAAQEWRLGASTDTTI